jgi:hypothetical protein
METAPFFEAMGILTGEHRSPGGSAGRRCAKTKIEENSLARHAIKRGSMDNLVSVNTRVRPGPIIGQAVENVRTMICGRSSALEENKRKKDVCCESGRRSEPDWPKLHRKPLPERASPSYCRQVLECGCPLPFFSILERGRC